MVAPTGYKAVNLQPLAVAAQGQAKPVQPKQGFMPYKWHAQQACAQQLPPGGFSLGKRSASASLVEPSRKRLHTGALP